MTYYLLGRDNKSSHNVNTNDIIMHIVEKIIVICTWGSARLKDLTTFPT